MNEFKNIPVKITDGDDGFEVYEYEYGFCMTTEELGKQLGYPNPRDQMSKLLRRHKEALQPHQFVVSGDYKIGRGRPTFFYDLDGCEKCAGIVRTAQAKDFLVRLIDKRIKLEAIRIKRIEAHWFGKRPFWPEVRDRIMLGQNFREIAEAMGRSASSVRNAVRKMIEVGILMPLRAAQALAGRAKKTVLDYGRKYYEQQRLPFDGTTEGV